MPGKDRPVAARSAEQVEVDIVPCLPVHRLFHYLEGPVTVGVPGTRFSPLFADLPHFAAGGRSLCGST